MRDGLHPSYKAATITCACGNTVKTRTTTGNMDIDICSKCHPFYTGTQKLVDTGGRIERFRRRYNMK